MDVAVEEASGSSLVVAITRVLFVGDEVFLMMRTDGTQMKLIRPMKQIFL
ncbi:hypothetical protein OAT16_00045 [Prolixibacteraceae bacterium]|nr:hypothetical protein [Prolixibacteraceae bacterium]